MIKNEEETIKRNEMGDEPRIHLIRAMCNLQQMHDDIEKDDKFLSDPKNPFIDNGMSLSMRFGSIEEEMFAKTEYLKEMMLDSKILTEE